MSASELFHAYRSGWRDAVVSKSKRLQYTQHKTRQDLTEQYNRGYEAGRRAFAEAMAVERKRVGYKPSVLRAAGGK